MSRRDGNHALSVSEAAEHSALFAWAAANRGACPELEYVIHVPNEGKRAPWAAARMGISAGVPDVLVLHPSADGQFAGLAVELKAGRGKPTAEQSAWVSRLIAVGWLAYVHTSRAPGEWTRVAVAIAEHLGAPWTVPAEWRDIPLEYLEGE